MIVNKRRAKYDVYIGRPSIFGNPYSMESEADRDKVIAQYKEYFLKRVEVDFAFRQAVLALRGKVLGCFCAPKKCHGDVILEWLEKNQC